MHTATSRSIRFYTALPIVVLAAALPCHAVASTAGNPNDDATAQQRAVALDRVEVTVSTATRTERLLADVPVRT